MSAEIDPDTFGDLKASAGDEFVAELVDTFAEETPRILAELRAARADNNADAFRRAAHSLKSNSATFGARAPEALARALELAGLAADPARDQAAIDALQAALDSAAAALKELARG